MYLNVCSVRLRALNRHGGRPHERKNRNAGTLCASGSNAGGCSDGVVVSADVKKCVVGDVVDEATLIERSSSLVREYRTNADAEKAIAAEIQKLPGVSYLAGWSEDDAERGELPRASRAG
ncbi:MAG: hypothetical protein XD88_2016, partial [Methanocalculus sp. 52_23]